MKISKKRLLISSFITFIILLIILPFVLNTYLLYLLTSALIFSIFALSYNMVLGYTGKVSFAHGIFFGLGAYIVAIALSSEGLPLGIGTLSYWLAYPLGIILSMTVAIGVGVIAFKLKDIYFTMFTLALAGIFHSLVVNLRSITQGIDGIVVMRNFNLNLVVTKISFISPTNFYYFTLLIFLVAMGIMYMIVSSPFGKMLKGLKSNIDRIKYAGLDPYKIQILNWIISCSFAAVAGGLFAVHIGHVEPQIGGIMMSATPLVMVLLGGLNVFIGPIVGAVLWVFGKSYLSGFAHWFLAMGVLIIFVSLFLPQGIVGSIRRLLEGEG